MDGRKMAIVPFKLWEELKRWKAEQLQRPRLPPDPKVSATASLQRDLSSVMANEDMSEAEKSQLFGQTLHKFKLAHQKALKQEPLKASLLPESSTEEPKINQRILESVPTTMRKKAKLLVSMLKDNPNLAWDDDGTVRLYGQPVPGSNIIDLVNDVLRQRKTVDEPTGWKPFAEALRQVNVPQDIVGNRARWEWIHRSMPDLPTPPSPMKEEIFTTPKSKRKRKTPAISTIKTSRHIKREKFSGRRQLDPDWEQM